MWSIKFSVCIVVIILMALFAQFCVPKPMTKHKANFLINSSSCIMRSVIWTSSSRINRKLKPRPNSPCSTVRFLRNRHYSYINQWLFMFCLEMSIKNTCFVFHILFGDSKYFVHKWAVNQQKVKWLNQWLNPNQVTHLVEE